MASDYCHDETCAERTARWFEENRQRQLDDDYWQAEALGANWPDDVGASNIDDQSNTEEKRNRGNG